MQRARGAAGWQICPGGREFSEARPALTSLSRGDRVFSEARPALTKATAGGKAAGTRAAAAEALAMLAFIAAEEPDDVDGVLALLAGLWRDGAARDHTLPYPVALAGGAGVLACGLDTELDSHQNSSRTRSLGPSTSCAARVLGETR